MCAQSEGEAQCFTDASGSVPFRLPAGSLAPSSHLAVGGLHACAIEEGGAVRCLGPNTDRGETGCRGYMGRRPCRVPRLESPRGLALGLGYSCAWLADGHARCWGLNVGGALGNERIRYYTETPQPVTGLQGVTQLSASYTGKQTCALQESGAVLCWGYRPAGAESFASEPIQLPGVEGIRGIEVGVRRVFAWNEAGEVLEWLPRTRPNEEAVSGYFPPTRVEGLPAIVEVYAGTSHQCARTEEGHIWCWGMNNYGQLGDGEGATLDAPFRVPAPSSSREDT